MKKVLFVYLFYSLLSKVINKYFLKEVYIDFSTALEDKYSCIADLDDDHEDEKWCERTELITRIDHENYIESARSILDDIICNSIDICAAKYEILEPVLPQPPPRPRSQNLTNYRSGNNSLDVSIDSEYESANEFSFASAAGMTVNLFLLYYIFWGGNFREF